MSSQPKPRAEAIPQVAPQPPTTPDAARREELLAVSRGEPIAHEEAAKHPTLADDPHWYKDAIIYQLHVKAYQDSSGDGIGDFAGLTRRLDYIASLGVTAIWLLPFYPSPLRDDGYDIADYTNVHPDYGTRRDFRTFVREAHKRGLRVITELVINHTSDLHPWFGESRSARDNPKRDWYVWSDDQEQLRRRADHLHRHRDQQLGLGPAFAAVLLASVLQPSARSELRQPGRGARHHAGDALLAGPGRRRAAAGRGAVPGRARRHQQREPAGDARRAEATPGRARQAASQPHAAGRGQPVAARRAPLLRRRRRVPHGLPLPAHAAHLDRAAQGGPHADRRDHGEHAADPRRLPVGALPAQPRRADARDGDRRGARLHVVRVRRRPAGAHQPGHPPPPGAAGRQQPPPDRAAQLAAAVDAGHAGHLLRRRDRDGRQRLPRRPQRGPDADAVDARTATPASHRPMPPRSTRR